MGGYWGAGRVGCFDDINSGGRSGGGGEEEGVVVVFCLRWGGGGAVAEAETGGEMEEAVGGWVDGLREGRP